MIASVSRSLRTERTSVEVDAHRGRPKRCEKCAEHHVSRNRRRRGMRNHDEDESGTAAHDRQNEGKTGCAALDDGFVDSGEISARCTQAASRSQSTCIRATRSMLRNGLQARRPRLRAAFRDGHRAISAMWCGRRRVRQRSQRRSPDVSRRPRPVQHRQAQIVQKSRPRRRTAALPRALRI